MKLSVGERIMLLRIRKGVSKKDLGNAAFSNLSAPNIKIKKIETGVQLPTDDELKTIARCLEVSDGFLIGIEAEAGGSVLSAKITDKIPAMAKYIDMFNMAASAGQFSIFSSVLDAMCRDESIREDIGKAIKNQVKR